MFTKSLFFCFLQANSQKKKDLKDKKLERETGMEPVNIDWLVWNSDTCEKACKEAGRGILR